MKPTPVKTYKTISTYRIGIKHLLLLQMNRTNILVR
jgi:hypothetical protein